MSLTKDSNYILETYNSAALIDHLALPELDLKDAVEAISDDKVGDSPINNFEGSNFNCLNGISQLPIDSDVSEGDWVRAC
jgi:hypothetical protein